MYDITDLLLYFRDYPKVKELIVANPNRSMKVKRKTLSGVLQNCLDWENSGENVEFWEGIYFELRSKETKGKP